MSHPVDTTVDLNQFEWFDSSAPLHLHSEREIFSNTKQLCVCFVAFVDKNCSDVMVIGGKGGAGDEAGRKHTHDLDV